MKLTERELDLVQGIFSELVRMPYDQQNRIMGSLTIPEMQDLYYRLKYRHYMKEHGIKKLSDMTPEDYADFEEESFWSRYSED